MEGGQRAGDRDGDERQEGIREKADRRDEVCVRERERERERETETETETETERQTDRQTLLC